MGRSSITESNCDSRHIIKDWNKKRTFRFEFRPFSGVGRKYKKQMQELLAHFNPSGTRYSNHQHLSKLKKNKPKPDWNVHWIQNTPVLLNKY